MADYSEPAVTGDRVEELLERLLELPDEEQAGALERLCSENAELTDAIRSRFELFRRMLGVDAAPREVETFGEFVLERELGRGGMGVVYLARQRRADTERLVALKLVRDRGLFSPQARERFRREADAAFRLDHPAICPVLDVGEVDGTPYLAMRYVAGETLAQRIAMARHAEGHLSLGGSSSTDATGSGTEYSSCTATDRVGGVVAFIEQVARALHAAHEAGLVHRDVKPGNLMVTPQGSPVLLDFGLVRDTTDETSRLTLTGQPIGTPAYMSPEQISPKGRGLDRTTDVYSLGATLFEALTLRPPFMARTREDLFRQILSDNPPDPSRLSPGIPRDIVVVLHTALDKDPTRRYATALEFAEDLRRARERQPILARPPGVVRRLRLWRQRNPLASAILALLAVSQIVIAVLAVQASRSAEDARVAERDALSTAEDARAAEGRATTHFALARRVVNELTRTADVHLANVPWLEPVRRDLFAKALAFHDRILETEDNDPAARFDAGMARRNAAGSRLSLGEMDVAEQLLADAKVTFESLPAETAGVKSQLAWVRILESSILQRKDDMAGARRELEAAIELLRADRERDPLGAEIAMVSALRDLAELSVRMEDPTSARPPVDEALAILAQHPAASDMATDRAQLLGLSARLHRDARNFPDANTQFEAAAQLLRDHVAQSEFDRVAWNLLGTNRIAFARMCRSINRYRDAAQALGEARAVFEKLSSAFPETVNYRANLATVFVNTASLKRRQGVEGEGLEELELATPLAEALVAENPEQARLRLMLSDIHGNIGNRIWRQSPADAIPHFKRALDALEPLFEARRDDPRYLNAAAGLSNMLALSLSVTHRDEEARPAMAQARDYAKRLVELRPGNHRYRRALGLQLYNDGNWHASEGDFDTAASRWRECCDTRRWLVSQPGHDSRNPFDLVLAWVRLGWTEDLRGDGSPVWEEARQEMAEWSDVQRTLVTRTADGRFYDACLSHGFAVAFARGGDDEAAAEQLRAALSKLEPITGGAWSDLELLLALTLDAELADRAGDAVRARASAVRAAELAARVDHRQFENELPLERMRRGLRRLQAVLPSDAEEAHDAVRRATEALGGG